VSIHFFQKKVLTPIRADIPCLFGGKCRILPDMAIVRQELAEYGHKIAEAGLTAGRAAISAPAKAV
jgi:hypothetical protein